MSVQIKSIDFDYDRAQLWGGLLPDPSIIMDIILQGTRELGVNGVTIPFADTVSDDEAYVLWSVFSPLPASILSYIFEDRTVAILAHDDFRALQDDFLISASPSMGASVTGDSFVIDRNLLLDPQRAEKAQIAVWYALGSLLALDLNDIENFDSHVFQAQFVRYVRGRTEGVSPDFREFFEALFDSEILGRTILRNLYAEKMGVDLPTTWQILSTHLPMTANVQAQFRPGFLTQIQEQGFTLNLGDIGMSIGMVNAKDRDRPESDHELRMLFYSRSANQWFSSHMSIGDWTPAVLLSWGLMATYQTPRPESSKQGRVLLGAGFDLGIHEESGLILHSFFGVPVFVTAQGIEDESWLPYWEAGIVRLGSNDSLFIGLSASASFLDSTTQYYGLVARYENF